MLQDAVEVVGARRRGPLLLTAEHASNRLPRPWRASAADRRLLATHWGWDLGIAAVTRAFARRTASRAVLARATRLLIDVNREPWDPTSVLQRTDDGAPGFNREVDHAERVARFHEPYHAAIDTALRGARPRWLVSMHSFTPALRGEARAMEAGVLFDQHDEEAVRLAAALNAEGVVTALNEPYSGKAGLIYSAARHGTAHGVPYLELELRQDRISSRSGAEAMALHLHRAWDRAGL